MFVSAQSVVAAVMGTVASSSTDFLVRLSARVESAEAVSAVGSGIPAARQDIVDARNIASDPANVFALLYGSLGLGMALPVMAAAASPKLDIITVAAARCGSMSATIASVHAQK